MIKMRDRYKFTGDILNSLLYYSTKDKFVIPTIREFIIKDIILGSLDYVGMEIIPKKHNLIINYSKNKSELYLNGLFFRSINETPNTFQSKDIQDSISNLIHFREHKINEGLIYECLLYDILEPMFKEKIISTIKLKDIKSIEKRFNLFYEEEKNDIIEIGTCMRKFIDMDLNILNNKSLYFW